MKETVYEVVPSASKWALQLRGSDSKEIFPTRDEAVARGRILCKESRPSRLRVRKLDADAR